MKTSLLILTVILCLVTVSPADTTKCQLIRIDSPAARDALRGPDFPRKLTAALAVGILTQSNSNELLRKLGSKAKPIKAADAGFTVSTATRDNPPETIELTFRYRGRSRVVSLFEHQSLVVAAPDDEARDRYSIYLFRLE